MSKYDNIINLPHYELKYHKRMSNDSRASQFAAFAALTGYYDLVKETSRIVDSKIILSEDMKNNINIKLQKINESINDKPEINVIYFEKDKSKNGGKYINYIGNIKRIDLINNILIFTSNKRINLYNVYDILY